jgi:glutathione S-transferase
MEPFTLSEIASHPSELKIRAVFPNATPDFLFDAFTQPDLLAQWWVPQAELQARPGGTFRFRWTDKNWTLFGTLLAFERGKHLKFTWKWEHAPELPQRTVDLSFSASGSGCVLDLTHGRYGASPRDLQDRENHRTGWHHFLNRLSRLVPGGARVESEAA